MATTCRHGFAPDSCLICRTLGGKDTAVVAADRPAGVIPRPERARPDVVYSAPPDRHGRRSHRGSLFLVLMALLAVGAAVWILAGVVFTILHLLELVAVAFGAGWVGYKIGHFRGSRHPRAPRG